MTSDTLAHIANWLLLATTAGAPLALLDLPLGGIIQTALNGAVLGIAQMTVLVALMLWLGRRFKITPRDLAIGAYSGIVLQCLFMSPVAAATAVLGGALWFALRLTSAMLSLKESHDHA